MALNGRQSAALYVALALNIGSSSHAQQAQASGLEAAFEPLCERLVGDGEIVEGGARLVDSAAGSGGDEIVKAAASGTESDWPARTGMLRDAAKGKGNFGIGAGTREQAQAMGEAWVGPGFRASSDGKILVSADGLRQYRSPSFKPKQGKFQANFESRPEEMTQWQLNGHLDIVDSP